MKDQTVEEIEATEIDKNLPGLYTEFLIRNMTDTELIVIDQFGGKITLPQLRTSLSGPKIVEAVVRTHNGKRVDHLGREKPIPTKKITIPFGDFKLGPRYIQDLDVLICTKYQVSSAIHPNQTQVYEDALAETIEALKEKNTLPTVRVFANDPTGKTKQLWIYLHGAIVPIKVSEFKGAAATVSITTMVGPKVVNEFNIVIDDILTGNGKLDFSSGDTYFIGPTEQEVKFALKNKRDSINNAIPEEKVEHLLKQKETEYADEFNSLRTELDMAKNELILERKTHKLKIEELTVDKDQLYEQVKFWKSIDDTKSEKRQTVSKEKQEAERFEKERLKTEAERMKYYSVLWKVVGGVAIAVATWMIKEAIDNYRK